MERARKKVSQATVVTVVNLTKSQKGDDGQSLINECQWVNKCLSNGYAMCVEEHKGKGRALGDKKSLKLGKDPVKKRIGLTKVNPPDKHIQRQRLVQELAICLAPRSKSPCPR